MSTSDAFTPSEGGAEKRLKARISAALFVVIRVALCLYTNLEQRQTDYEPSYRKRVTFVFAVYPHSVRGSQLR